MGTVGGYAADLDVIHPGPGIGDRPPGAHDVIYRAPWGERVLCACGTVCMADRARGAYIGGRDHVLPFGDDVYQFDTSGAAQGADEAPDESWAPAPRSNAARQIMDALGIEADEVPVDVLAADLPAGLRTPPALQPTVSAADPYGAKLARDRERKDARNRADRAKRVRDREAALARDPGRTFRGFAPKR